MEMLTGIQTLKAFGVEHRAVQNYSDLFVDVLNVSLSRGAALSLWVDALHEHAAAGLAPGAAAPWAPGRCSNGSLTHGQDAGLNALAGAVLVPLANLVTTGGQLQLLGSYLERIDDVLDAPPERPRDKPGAGHPALTGGIELEQVSLPLRARCAAGGPGRVACASSPGRWWPSWAAPARASRRWPTCCWASTCPPPGACSTTAWTWPSWTCTPCARQMGVVLQDPAFFGTTLRANITLDEPDASPGAVVEAPRSWRSSTTTSWPCPCSYNTPLVDRGASLSGGQRQRLALARALVQQARRAAAGRGHERPGRRHRGRVQRGARPRCAARASSSPTG